MTDTLTDRLATLRSRWWNTHHRATDPLCIRYPGLAATRLGTWWQDRGRGRHCRVCMMTRAAARARIGDSWRRTLQVVVL